jgi:hypothetical protein
LIDPLHLIIAVKTATKYFNDAHKDAKDHDYEDTKTGVEDFIKWLKLVHLGLIEENSYAALRRTDAQDGDTYVPVRSGLRSGGVRGLGKVKKHVGEGPVWFVITPVDPETKVPTTEQARCSELIAASCIQLQEFGAMSFETAITHFGGWVMEANSNGRVIIEGTRAYGGRASAKGKFWELHTSTTKPTGVKLVDMEMYEEFTKHSRARDVKHHSAYHKRQRDEIK